MPTSLNTRHNLPIAAAGLALRVSGAVVASLALAVGMVANGTAMTPPYQALLIIATLLALICVRGPKPSIDHTPATFPTALTTTVLAWLIVLGVLLLLGYATKTSSEFSRRLILTWAVVTPVLIAAVRFWLSKLIVSMNRKTAIRRRAVIAGVNSLGESLAAKLQADPRFGLTLDGFFDDRGLERLGNRLKGQLLGRLMDLPNYVREHRIDRIYIALPIRNLERVSQLLDELHDTTASIYYVPDVFVFDLIQCRTDEIDGMPVVALCETPFFGARGLAKRLSDILLASIILVAISPILITIAAIIKLTTPGSVIFKQRRYGLDGEEIIVYKFRTMYVSEDGGDIRQASREDNRVTPFGAFLRRNSLDELPQFFNVLEGTMSVVGPRPHAVAHNEQYRRLIKGYMIRHKVNPGVTGLAQVRGFRGETATVDDMRRRVESDLEYLRNWSLELDLRIVFQTAMMVLRDKQAY